MVVNLSYSLSGQLRVNPLRFCFRHRIVIPLLDEFSVHDVAVVRDNVFVPLEAPTVYVEDEGALCARFIPEVGVTYMPIIRMSKWQDVKRELFTTVELVLLIIDVSAYTILLCLMLLLVVPLIRSRRFPFGAGVLIPLCAFTLTFLVTVFVIFRRFSVLSHWTFSHHI